MRCYRFVYLLLSCLASFLHRLLRRSVATETRVSLQRLPIEPEAELFGFSTTCHPTSVRHGLLSGPVSFSSVPAAQRVRANQSASGKPSLSDPSISQHIGCNNRVRQVQPLSRPSSTLYLTFFVILRLLPEMILPSGIKSHLRICCSPATLWREVRTSLRNCFAHALFPHLSTRTIIVTLGYTALPVVSLAGGLLPFFQSPIWCYSKMVKASN